MQWNFEPEKILRSRRLPIVCTVCAKDGHPKATCPELEVPKIGFIPPPDFGYFALLDNVCWNVFRSFAQCDKDLKNRSVAFRRSRLTGFYFYLFFSIQQGDNSARTGTAHSHAVSGRRVEPLWFVVQRFRFRRFRLGSLPHL